VFVWGGDGVLVGGGGGRGRGGGGWAGGRRGEAEERCLGEVKGWLRVNAVRTLTVDSGAWICFVIAAVKALGPA